ncbi:hypothetical protein LCGC14_1117270 [marine sediment metagenome]|uniref:Methyltransferase domain-containing protein n=1 Tax=marine sediment metagenome TaxID=412755 RepID=A0A0F9QAU0_9ZZZZ
MPPTYEEWKRDNWNKAHRESDITALTGTGLAGHLTTLEVNSLLVPDASVLCIGVGMGVWIQDIAKRGCNIWALDVSPVAGARMPANSNFTTNPRDLPSDYFDLVMSLWVAPHMSDHDLQEQFNGVIRSLKLTGTFAIHYKEPLDSKMKVDNREGADDEFFQARSAGMLRRRKHFANMVFWAGGYVKQTTNKQSSYFYQIIEAVAHIGKLQPDSKE